MIFSVLFKMLSLYRSESTEKVVCVSSDLDGIHTVGGCLSVAMNLTL